MITELPKTLEIDGAIFILETKFMQWGDRELWVSGYFNYELNCVYYAKPDKNRDESIRRLEKTVCNKIKNNSIGAKNALWDFPQYFSNPSTAEFKTHNN